MKKTVRFLSLILALLMVLPFALTGCSPKDDDKDEDEDETIDPGNYYITLSEVESSKEAAVDFNSRNFVTNNQTLNSSNVSKVQMYENEGNSLHWDATSAIRISNPEIADWGEYDKLVISVYSGKKTFGTVQIRFENPFNNGTSMNPYFRYPFVIDWTGWKTLEIDLHNMTGNYSPTLNQIGNIYFDNSGWELDPKTGNDLYFSTFWLVKREYEIECPDGVDISDSTIYDKVKDQWREYSLGNPNGYKNAGKEITAKIASVNSGCKNAWDLFKSTYKKNTRDSAFNLTIVQGKSGDESKISSFYSYVLNMVKGYGMVGSEYYHNEKLLKDIKAALDYCYDFYYGPNVWEQGTYGNWWYWDIGVPLTLTEILVDLEHDLEYDDLVKYFSPFDYLDYYPSMTACNKVWIAICVFGSAFVQEDAERILISKQLMNDVFDYVESGDGFYEDGSFIQHGAFPYTGGYGLSMLDTLTELMLIMRGSRFDFIEDNVSNVYRWVFENYQPIIYGSNLMASVRGREVDRNTSEAAAFNSAVNSLIKMTTFAPKDVKPELESLIRCYMKAANNNFSSVVPLMLTDYAINLYDNDTVAVRSDYNVTKVLGNMDRIVQHGEKYGVCIAPNSTRIYKYEAINNENMDGWYQSEGMIYIYTDGFDYNYNFFNYVNPYRIPGTTVSTMERTVENIGGYYGSSPFVGGVEAGKYGLAVFQLGYGSNKYVTPNITANKSYFLFDNEIVCVGSAIKDTSGKEVVTIVENRNIRSGDKFTVDGTETTPVTDTPKKVTANYMHFDNMGGYVFPGGADVYYNKADKVKTSFLELWLSHGTNPTTETYAYIYLPEATVAETENYQENPDVEILEQTNNIHVVRENKLGITGYAFYGKGSSNGVTVTNECCVMITENSDGSKTINISDPTHLLQVFTVTVELDGVSSVVSADEGATARIDGGKVVIDVNQLESVGETYTVTVK